MDARDTKMEGAAEQRDQARLGAVACIDWFDINHQDEMNITKITIGRLYNAGNYEHVRYELTAEVKEGESASAALQGMEKLLCALNPKPACGVKSNSELERERLRIGQLKEMTDDQFSRSIGQPEGGKSAYIQRVTQGLADDTVKRAEWDHRHSQARKLLDDLGGASKWKDAKLSWDNDIDEY